MEVPIDYDGPALEIVIKDTKCTNDQEVIENLLNNIDKRGSKVCMFLKDKEDGELIQKVLAEIKKRDLQILEMKDFMDKVH